MYGGSTESVLRLHNQSSDRCCCSCGTRRAHAERSAPYGGSVGGGGSGCSTKRSVSSSVLLLLLSLADVGALVGLAALEYIFRWTQVIPIRSRPYPLSPTDWTNQSTLDLQFDRARSPHYPQSGFWIRASELSEIFVYIYAFSFPVLVIVLGELLLFCLANQTQKPLPGGACSPIHVPHTIRRLYRFSVSFLCGMLALMVVVDCLKVSVGSLRPRHLEMCRPAPAKFVEEDINTNAIALTTAQMAQFCSTKDTLLLRKARTSWPSMRAAISMYSSIFVAVYIHGSGNVHHCKFVLPALLVMTTILVSMVTCGVFLLENKDASIEDVVSGQLLGTATGLYFGFVVLRGFRFQETVSKRRLLRQIIAASNTITDPVSELKSKLEHKKRPHVEGKKRLQPFMYPAVTTATDPFMDSPVRLRRAPTSSSAASGIPRHHQAISLPGGPGSKSATASTFFPGAIPIGQPQKAPYTRKSVTLPLDTSGDNGGGGAVSSVPRGDSSRYSVLNLPSSRRHLLLNRHLPRVSQELMDLLSGTEPAPIQAPGPVPLLHRVPTPTTSSVITDQMAPS